MIWVIVIIVVAYFAISIIGTHNRNVKNYVTSQGGMMNKYSTLVNYLQESGLTLTKLSNDTIILSSNIIQCRLDFVSPDLDVTINGSVPTLGPVKKRWTFPAGYPQEKMIEEVENYFDWIMRNSFNS